MNARASDPAALYDRVARFYDWEHRDFSDDLPLYLGLATACAGPILDAACGTGRVTLALAKEGFSVTGVDASSAMLEIARSKVEAARLVRRVRLVQGDMRSMELGERYGMALVALSSFHHLLTLDGQRKALERLAGHLATKGLLVIDLLNPSPEWLAAGDSTLVHQLTAPYPSPDGPHQLSKFVARTTHFETQSETSVLLYDQTGPGGEMTRFCFQMETRLLFRYEAELLLEEAGFRLRDLYGGYDLESYQASSPRMILVAERR
ncbi:MAG: class I SAM-dependent methyltransferase [Sphingomonadaceae bacterium]